jgi:hypothetical protein
MVIQSTSRRRGRDLLRLAGHQQRESGAGAAIAAAEGAVTLLREVVGEGPAPELFEALLFLGDCCRSAGSSRVADVWKEYLGAARRFGTPSHIEHALLTLGECEAATTADRVAVWQELAATYEEEGHDGHRACALESLALVVPLTEAVALIDAAGRLRAVLEPAAQPFPADHTLDALFERLKDTNRLAALAVARLQVQARRGRTAAGLIPLRVAEALEKVAEVADEQDAREALREALALFRSVYQGTRGQFGSSRVDRVEQKLRRL